MTSATAAAISSGTESPHEDAVAAKPFRRLSRQKPLIYARRGGGRVVISVALFGLAFICPLLGAGIGVAVRSRLPEHHLSRDAIDVIKLAMGLMATLVALTLGLLISSAKTYHATVESEYKKILAAIVHL